MVFGFSTWRPFASWYNALASSRLLEISYGDNSTLKLALASSRLFEISYGDKSTSKNGGIDDFLRWCNHIKRFDLWYDSHGNIKVIVEHFASCGEHYKRAWVSLGGVSTKFVSVIFYF